MNSVLQSEKGNMNTQSEWVVMNWQRGGSTWGCQYYQAHARMRCSMMQGQPFSPATNIKLSIKSTPTTNSGKGRAQKQWHRDATADWVRELLSRIDTVRCWFVLSSHFPVQLQVPSLLQPPRFPEITIAAVSRLSQARLSWIMDSAACLPLARLVRGEDGFDVSKSAGFRPCFFLYFAFSLHASVTLVLLC